jgi:AcrR family transcriptional regulator
MTAARTTRPPGSADGHRVPPRRTRDAGATRQALLAAAQDLFGRRGYERTTTREIGEAAGVDPALISRYYGSKADLYLAAVATERLDDDDADERDRDDAPFDDLAQVVEIVLRRTARRGPGPILQALVRDDAPEEIRAAATARLERRMVGPIAAGYEAAGLDRPTLRAQLAVAAVLGVGLGRSLGWFDELHAADPGDLAGLVTEALVASPDVSVGRPSR